jgi:hypothetical protein
MGNSSSKTDDIALEGTLSRNQFCNAVSNEAIVNFKSVDPLL